MIMSVIYFFLACLVSFFLCLGVGELMTRLKIVDKPRAAARKIHKKSIPLAGGLAIYLAFFGIVGVLLFTNQLGEHMSFSQYLALFIGATILMVGGLIDDIRPLSPLKQLIAPIIATIVIISFGIGPTEITNPFGDDVLKLDTWKIAFGSLGTFFVLADGLVFFWMMGMMYTTKLLDGLDGLVSGIAVIGAVIIFFLTRQPQWFQPEIGHLALIFAGALLGFLFLNWHPAKLFLGEGGSLFAGFIIGALAIISGSKIATTLLVMGIPILDIIRVMVRRFQKKRSLFQGDNEHLHFKLLQSGLSHKETVLLFYTVALSCGMIGLFVQSSQKFIALMFLVILMFVLGIWFMKKEQ